MTSLKTRIEWTHLLLRLAVILAASAIVFGILMALPLLSVALTFALVIGAGLVVAFTVLLTNLQWSLWHGRRPFFFGIADLGFLTCMASVLAYCGASFATSRELIVQFIAGLVFLGILRALFLQYEAWLLGMALPFILLAFFGAYIRFVALHPEWFFDFMSAWLLLTGMGLILTGSIASLAEARRGRARLRAPAAGKIALGVLGGVLLVLAGGSALLTASQAKRGSSETEAGVVTVYFEGGRLRQELPPSAGEVSFLLQNKDLLVHSFTVRPMRVDCRTDEFGRRQCDTIYGDDVADVAVGPGSERMVTIQLNPGDYEVRCRVPGHSDLLRGWHLE